MAENGQERRGARRVDASLKVNISSPAVEEAGASLETINISTSGAYFHSDRFLEPMTKLALQLELPMAGGEDGVEDVALVACEGLVVRTTPEQVTEGQETYEIAVFFTHLEAGVSEILERHIATLLQTSE